MKITTYPNGYYNPPTIRTAPDIAVRRANDTGERGRLVAIFCGRGKVEWIGSDGKVWMTEWLHREQIEEVTQ